MTFPKLAKEQSLRKKKQSTNSHGKELWSVDEVVNIIMLFQPLFTNDRQKRKGHTV